MKIWTFYRERVDGCLFPRWTYRCNEADRSGVSMLATVGPMSLASIKVDAARSGWSEDQPTQIFREITNDSKGIDRINVELRDLASKIKTPPKAGIQFS